MSQDSLAASFPYDRESDPSLLCRFAVFHGLHRTLRSHLRGFEYPAHRLNRDLN